DNDRKSSRKPNTDFFRNKKLVGLLDLTPALSSRRGRQPIPTTGLPNAFVAIPAINFLNKRPTVPPLLEERVSCPAGASSLVVLTAGVRSSNSSNSQIIFGSRRLLHV